MAVNRSGGILKFLKLINVKQFPANLLAQFMEEEKNPPPKKSIGTLIQYWHQVPSCNI